MSVSWTLCDQTLLRHRKSAWITSQMVCELFLSSRNAKCAMHKFGSGYQDRIYINTNNWVNGLLSVALNNMSRTKWSCLWAKKLRWNSPSTLMKILARTDYQSFDSLKSMLAFHCSDFRFGVLPFPGKSLSGQGLGNAAVFLPCNFSGRSLRMISPISGSTNLHYERQNKSSECR